MNKWLQFKLLTINAFRILWKSKVLVSQLILLLLIGITILATIVLSNYSLNASKEAILSKGNLADFTITIPESIREQSLKEDNTTEDKPVVYLQEETDEPNNSFASINSGETPADMELKQELNNLGLQYALSKTNNLSDILSGNSFIVTNSQLPSSIEPNVVNKLILDKGSTSLPQPIYTQDNFREYYDQFMYFYGFAKNWDEWNQANFANNFFNYETYMQRQPWNLAKAIANGIWRTTNESIQKMYPSLLNLTLIPQNQDDFNKNFNIFQANSAKQYTINTNSYWYKYSQVMEVENIVFNEYGFKLNMWQSNPVIPALHLPFVIEIYDPSSYFSVASTNFINANKGSKAFLPEQTMKDAMQLPFKNYAASGSDINPAENIVVTNPDTGIKEQFPDFVTWVESLDSKYKIKVNSLDFIIIGSGLSADMMYPALSVNQMLVDSKNSGVLYTNNSGFARANGSSSGSPDIYYSVKFPSYWTEWQRNNAFAQLQNYTVKNYNQNTAYYLDDPNQPNQVLYLRTNFLNNLQKIILIITLVISVVIGLLSLFFIATLLRSIIKQSKVTFGIGLANGINKTQLAFSFFPFALIPALFCGVVGFIAAYFLLTPMNGVYSDYWTISIPQIPFDWWLLLIIPAIVFVILFILNLFVVFWTLRKNTQSIMNDAAEFKINWFIIHTKWLTSKLSSTGSFRLTFMMSNMTRFLILTLVVFGFISLATITVGSLYQFQNALSYTDRNKEYTYAFDLYSPTINNGYYSAMPYSEIGVTGQGIYNEYLSNQPFGGSYASPASKEAEQSGAPYMGKEYGDALIYPYSQTIDGDKVSPKYMTSLFMPSLQMALTLDKDIKFLSNKVISKMFLDMDLDLTGTTINPWDLCRTFLPEAIVSMADTMFQNQIETNYNFYYWLQTANSYAMKKIQNPDFAIPEEYTYQNRPIYYSTYLPNVNEQPFTFDGSEITDDFNSATNQKEWFFIKKTDPISNKDEWVVNQDRAFIVVPTYMVQQKALKLFIQIITNNENPLFQYWYKFVYDKNLNKGKENQVIPNYSFKLADGIVPVESSDETYTYIDANFIGLKGQKISNVFHNKIIGIKPSSKYVFLYDENNNDLKQLLNQNITKEDNSVVYPIIINEVVAKKHKLGVGDSIEIQAKNTYDRYNLTNIGVDPTNYAKFEVVGITNSKSEEQFYTSQKISNKILGFFDFTQRNADKEKAESTQWNGPKMPGKGYVPFNGVFTDQQIPQLAFNFGGIYLTSSLSTSSGSWDANVGDGEGQYGGAGGYAVSKNYSIINQLTAINYCVNKENNNEVVPIPEDKQNWLTVMPGQEGFDRNIYADWKPDNPNINIGYGTRGPTQTQRGDVMRRIIQVWGSTSPAVTQLQSVDTPYINMAIGPTIDNTIMQVEMVVMICLIPTLLIIIGLLASMIIVEARRLIAMLKVLGYSDMKNAFSFMFVYVIVLFLGTLLAIPFTYGVLSIVQTIAFSAFNIIIAPVAPVWIYFAAFGAVALIFIMLFIYVWNQLKKFNLAQEVSVR